MKEKSDADLVLALRKRADAEDLTDVQVAAALGEDITSASVCRWRMRSLPIPNLHGRTRRAIAEWIEGAAK